MTGGFELDWPRPGLAPFRERGEALVERADENAALLRAPLALLVALGARDWRALFIERRGLWAEARLTLLGHGLMEKLTRPRKSITVHVWVLLELAAGDEQALAQLTPERLAGKPFLPLPVLGVLGWWPGQRRLWFLCRRGRLPPGLRG